MESILTVCGFIIVLYVIPVALCWWFIHLLLNQKQHDLSYTQSKMKTDLFCLCGLTLIPYVNIFIGSIILLVVLYRAIIL